MRSFITDDFFKLYKTLPEQVKKLAKKSYAMWKEDPNHLSLQFKEIHKTEGLWSVRIGLHWRVLGLKEDDSIYWFWIGSHSEYDKLIDRFK